MAGSSSKGETGVSFSGIFESDLPDGLIVFNAPPMLLGNRKSQLLKNRSNFRKSSSRKLVSSKVIDDISGLFGNLGLSRPKPKPASSSSNGSGVKEDKKDANGEELLARPIRPTMGSTNRIKRTARRRLKTEPMNVAPSWLFDRFFNKKGNTTNDQQVKGFQPLTGFYRTPYMPTLCTDMENNPIKLHHISAMQLHKHKSAEEIRVEDYTTGHKEKLHRGPKFREPVGTDTMVRQGHSTVISTKHRCIPAMSEYKDCCFEELRLEHYMPSIAWKGRKLHSLSSNEMRNLEISINSDVFIFHHNHQAKGKVRYIGRLPGKPSSKTYVGVDLNEPLGNGNGCYNGTRMFRTAEGHARFVPLDAALPGHLFDATQGNLEEDEEDDAKQATASTSRETSTSGATGGESNEKNKCSVCWMNPISMFFQPCGHVCCCEQCSRKLKNCPMCRKFITAKHKAYLS